MIWVILFLAFWLPTLVFAIAMDGRCCFLGFHDWENEWVSVGKYLPLRHRFKCTRCGKVHED